MDPNVQVAFVSVLVAIVTTSGVVAVAIINRPGRNANKPVQAPDDAPLDEKDVLERMLGLISENERKEATIARLRLRESALEEEVRMLKMENTNLMLKQRPKGRT